jgi:hypothetical protein
VIGAAGRSPASGATRRMPSSTPWAMPREGSSGVDGTFHVSIRPAFSSNRQMSVNVPPESTPTRHLDALIVISYGMREVHQRLHAEVGYRERDC